MKNLYKMLVVVMMFMLVSSCSNSNTPDKMDDLNDIYQYYLDKIELGESRDDVIEKLGSQPVNDIGSHDNWDFENYHLEVLSLDDKVTGFIVEDKTISSEMDFSKFDNMTLDQLLEYENTNPTYDDIVETIGTTPTMIYKSDTFLTYSWNDKVRALHYSEEDNGECDVEYLIGYSDAFKDREKAKLDLKQYFEGLKDCEAKKYLNLIESDDSIYDIENKIDQPYYEEDTSTICWNFSDSILKIEYNLIDESVIVIEIKTSTDNYIGLEKSELKDMTYHERYEIYKNPTASFSKINALVGSECTSVRLVYDFEHSDKINDIMYTWEGNDSYKVVAYFNTDGLCEYLGIENN